MAIEADVSLKEIGEGVFAALVGSVIAYYRADVSALTISKEENPAPQIRAELMTTAFENVIQLLPANNRYRGVLAKYRDDVAVPAARGSPSLHLAPKPESE